MTRYGYLLNTHTHTHTHTHTRTCVPLRKPSTRSAEHLDGSSRRGGGAQAATVAKRQITSAVKDPHPPPPQHHDHHNKTQRFPPRSLRALTASASPCPLISQRGVSDKTTVVENANHNKLCSSPANHNKLCSSQASHTRRCPSPPPTCFQLPPEQGV